MSFKFRIGLLLLVLVILSGSNLEKRALSARQIIDLLNQDRVRHGLDVLVMNPTLNLAAMAKAQDMINKNYFSHTSPEGVKPWYWFQVLGYDYTYAGENLAEGYNDPVELEKSWMGSPTHRANILSPFYSEVGLAVAEDHNTNIVVQFFASKDNKVTLRQ